MPRIDSHVGQDVPEVTIFSIFFQHQLSQEDLDYRTLTLSCRIADSLPQLRDGPIWATLYIFSYFFWNRPRARDPPLLSDGESGPCREATTHWRKLMTTATMMAAKDRDGPLL